MGASLLICHYPLIIPCRHRKKWSGGEKFKFQTSHILENICFKFHETFRVVLGYIILYAKQVSQKTTILFSESDFWNLAQYFCLVLKIRPYRVTIYGAVYVVNLKSPKWILKQCWVNERFECFTESEVQIFLTTCEKIHFWSFPSKLASSISKQ